MISLINVDRILSRNALAFTEGIRLIVGCGILNLIRSCLILALQILLVLHLLLSALRPIKPYLLSDLILHIVRFL